MCGIIGYIGEKQADQILLTGLQRLEYRGYDSAGIGVIAPDHSRIETRKAIGRVAKLEGTRIKGTIGIGHTRWATHGKPTLENAHPHLDDTGAVAIVHNGIIENFLELKHSMRGHTFTSTTDSEVIAHLIEEWLKSGKEPLINAVQNSLKRLYGTYALCVIHKDKDEIVVARNGSPLVIGIGKGENFVASDISAIVEHTKKVIYLDDFETAVVKKESVTVFGRDGKKVEKKIVAVDWDVALAEKQGFKHFMLKEIHEQPDVIQNTLNAEIPDISARQIHVVACGSASYVALAGKYIIESFAKIPVVFDTASEFRYRNPIIGKGDLFISVSQSGETADTLEALRIAKKKGAKTLAIVNVMNSTIARESDKVIYTRAGVEVAVATTKAFTSQLIVFYLIAQKLAGKKIKGLQELPAAARRLLTTENVRHIAGTAKKYFRVYNFLFLGRNLNYPIALEGAMKLKETSYIHAEGYSAGEMKHGPIALVTNEVPTVAIAVRDSVHSKMVSSMEEIKARNGKVIAVATEGDKEIVQHCDDVFFVPEADEILTPVLTVIPLQLFAYFIADARDCDVDKPRNLAKSVTVE